MKNKPVVKIKLDFSHRRVDKNGHVSYTDVMDNVNQQQSELLSQLLLQENTTIVKDKVYTVNGIKISVNENLVLYHRKNDRGVAYGIRDKIPKSFNSDNSGGNGKILDLKGLLIPKIGGGVDCQSDKHYLMKEQPKLFDDSETVLSRKANNPGKLKNGIETITQDKGNAANIISEPIVSKLNIMRKVGKMNLNRYMRLMRSSQMYTYWMQHTEQELLQLALKLMYALQDVHDKGVLHLDIKSHNFMVDWNSKTKQWSVYLIDFGHSKAVDEEVRPGFTTIGYSAPETLYFIKKPKADDRHDRKKIDVWSIAMLLGFVLGEPNSMAYNGQFRALEAYKAYKEDHKEKIEKDSNANYLNPVKADEIHNLASTLEHNVLKEEIYDILEKMSKQDPAKRLTLEDSIDKFEALRFDKKGMPQLKDIHHAAIELRKDLRELKLEQLQKQETRQLKEQQKSKRRAYYNNINPKLTQTAEEIKAANKLELDTVQESTLSKFKDVLGKQTEKAIEDANKLEVTDKKAAFLEFKEVIDMQAFQYAGSFGDVETVIKNSFEKLTANKNELNILFKELIKMIEGINLENVTLQNAVNDLKAIAEQALNDERVTIYANIDDVVLQHERLENKIKLITSSRAYLLLSSIDNKNTKLHSLINVLLSAPTAIDMKKDIIECINSIENKNMPAEKKLDLLQNCFNIIRDSAKPKRFRLFSGPGLTQDDAIRIRALKAAYFDVLKQGLWRTNPASELELREKAFSKNNIIDYHLGFALGQTDTRMRVEYLFSYQFPSNVNHSKVIKKSGS